MLVQASTSRTTLSSHADDDLVPHSDQLRRLLTRLDKTDLIRLALRWLSSTEPHHLPPSLRIVKQPAQEPTPNKLLYQAIVSLNEERRARSLTELRCLWSGPMADAKVPKARAIDRILVDWPSLSYGMIAEVDLLYSSTHQTARNWTAVKLEYSDDLDRHARGFERLAPTQLRERFAAELAHYFEHHVFLQSPEEGWASDFTYLRVVLAPGAAEICGTGLHVLHIPQSQYLLYSGSLGRGSENKEMALSAFAQAAGATTLNYPRPAKGSVQARRLELDAAAEDKDGNRRTLGELKGKDPVALRQVLVAETGCVASDTRGAHSLAGVAGGGKAREMRSKEGIEDGPLVAPLKRRREEDVYSIGVRLPTPPPTDEEKSTPDLSGSEVVQRRTASRTATPTPHDSKARQQQVITTRIATKREARELFGQRKDDDQDLTKVERIDYELHLPFPVQKPYHRPQVTGTDETAIKLRIEGTHVLAGLRKLVEAGMDRTTSYDGGHERKLPGLPGWMTEVRGTKVVVELPPEEEEAEG